MGRIIWLASYPKSGNTWTRIFLLNLFMNPSKPLSINEIGEMSPSDSQLGWYTMLESRPADQWSLPEVAKLRLRVQEEIAGITPDSIFVKTHSPLLPWQGVPAFNMNVTAGAICIVRNPLDVVASYANHSGLDLDPMIRIMAEKDYLVPGGGERAPHPIGDWSQNVASWTARPHPAMHVMRYEDMLDDPVMAFGKLVRFLRLPKDRGRLDKALKFSSFDKAKKQEKTKGFNEASKRAKGFFRSGKAGGWRTELTPAQVRTVVNAHREQMERFGYVPEGY
ncbi:MAG: sulfotransferase [Rhodospirillaceae bacterium]|nr:sulfotransferase [Rhodospirillaceae bacterium]|tara:strand:- start:18499 stop:19335 length:837 start_codon:yes stop_codon:yes gene_type:complete